MKPWAGKEQLRARLERRRSGAAGKHVNKGLRDAEDWERFEDAAECGVDHVDCE